MTEPVAPVEIEAAPAVPNSDDDEVDFDPAYQAFYTWEKNKLQPGLNAQAAAGYQNAVSAKESRVLAVQKSGEASDAAAAAAASALTSLNAPGTTAISTTNLTLSAGLKNWTIPAGKDFPQGQPVFLAYRGDASKRMAGPLLTHDKATGACSAYLTPDPGAAGTYADWSMGVGVNVQTGPANFNREQRNANVAFIETDKGKVIEYTAGGFTQTFGAIQAGWHAEVVNKSSGDVGITTDGVTYKIYPFERRRLEWDGAAMTSTVLAPYYKVFTASDTWVKSPGYSRFGGLGWGAGCGGQVYTDGSSQWYRYGGSGGGCMPFLFPSAALPATVALTIGAGGLFSTAVTLNPGGSTTFGTYATFYGASAAPAYSGGLPPPVSVQTEGTGFRGVYDARNTSGATASPGLTGEYAGGQGARGRSLSGDISTGASGGGSVYGGGGGACSGTSSSPGVGGPSMFGGKGGDSTTPAGAAPGGGGYGGPLGHGARGEFRIWGFIG